MRPRRGVLPPPWQEIAEQRRALRERWWGAAVGRTLGPRGLVGCAALSPAKPLRAAFPSLCAPLSVKCCFNRDSLVLFFVFLVKHSPDLSGDIEEVLLLQIMHRYHIVHFVNLASD